ncbi:MAG: hypothetical protein PSX81_03780 [bacterium]|nr:hypothetical protein [bacterium]
MVNVKIEHISVESESINPALSINILVECNFLTESPISVSGTLSVDGKVVSYLTELKYFDRGYTELAILGEEQVVKINSGNRLNIYQTNLTALLSPIAIDWIEKSREKEREKSVNLSFEFAVRYIEMTAKSNRLYGTNPPFQRIKQSKEFRSYIISQSDWINRFYNYIGAGKFILVELPLIGEASTIPLWKDLTNELYGNIQEMDSKVKIGDWQSVIVVSRKFFENIKIGDNKAGNKKFRDDFNQKLKQLNHDDEGIKNLHDAIWQLFEFSSKFIHTKNKTGELKQIPTANKEDAYLVYSLSICLYNILIRNIK